MPDKQGRLLSVVMGVRDGARYLPAALESLRNQTFTDFTAYIVDNASRDGSGDVVRSIASHDDRFVLLERGRPGLSDCLRLAIAQDRSPFIARLDADDLCEPDRLAEQIAAFQQDEELVLIGSQAIRIGPSGQRFGRLSYPISDASIRKKLRTANAFCHSSVTMRRSAYDRAGGYRVGMRYGEDWDLWLRISRHGRMSNSANALVSHRSHPYSLTSGNPARYWISSVKSRAAVRAFDDGNTEALDDRMILRTALAKLGMSRRSMWLGLQSLHMRHRLKRGAIRARLRSGTAHGVQG